MSDKKIHLAISFVGMLIFVNILWVAFTLMNLLGQLLRNIIILMAPVDMFGLVKTRSWLEWGDIAYTLLSIACALTVGIRQWVVFAKLKRGSYLGITALVYLGGSLLGIIWRVIKYGSIQIGFFSALPLGVLMVALIWERYLCSPVGQASQSSDQKFPFIHELHLVWRKQS